MSALAALTAHPATVRGVGPGPRTQRPARRITPKGHPRVKTAHLITAARRALTTLRASEETVHTLTITTTHEPARHTLAYDSESVAARHNDGTVAYIDLSGTDFAEDLDAYAENALATSVRRPAPAHPPSGRLPGNPAARRTESPGTAVHPLHPGPRRCPPPRPDRQPGPRAGQPCLRDQRRRPPRQHSLPFSRSSPALDRVLRPPGHRSRVPVRAGSQRRVPHADRPPGGARHEPLHAALPARHRGARRSPRRHPCLARPPGRNPLPRAAQRGPGRPGQRPAQSAPNDPHRESRPPIQEGGKVPDQSTRSS